MYALQCDPCPVIWLSHGRLIFLFQVGMCTVTCSEQVPRVVEMKADSIV